MINMKQEVTFVSGGSMKSLSYFKETNKAENFVKINKRQYYLIKTTLEEALKLRVAPSRVIMYNFNTTIKLVCDKCGCEHTVKLYAFLNRVVYREGSLDNSVCKECRYIHTQDKPTVSPSRPRRKVG